MTEFSPNLGPGLLVRISGGMLLLMALFLATLLAATLSWIVLTKSDEAETKRFRAIETRTLAILEEGGLSGLSQKLDAVDTDFFSVPGAPMIAVWRVRGNSRVLHRSVPAGSGDKLADVKPGGTSDIMIDGQKYRVLSPDLTLLSQDWSTPMADVTLAIAVPDPGPEELAARQTVVAVWSGLALALMTGGLLHVNHARRYRDGLLEINAYLERAAMGETGLRIPDRIPAPELRELTQRLNTILPRFDDLVLGLRDLSASMAHELKTPLQVIRSGLTSLGRAEGKDQRDEITQAINRTIDLANARLHSIMQLFRLEAQVEIPMHSGVDLSRLAENAVDDLIDVLESGGRTVRIDIDPDVSVRGNAHLLDLLISNLLTNAAKYAPANARIEIALARSGTAFRLSVANTGPGFPDDVRKTAFDRFSRSRSSDVLPGSGIGLSLVRAIAARHGFRAFITPSQVLAEVVITGPLEGTA